MYGKGIALARTTRIARHPYAAVGNYVASSHGHGRDWSTQATQMIVSRTLGSFGKSSIRWVPYSVIWRRSLTSSGSDRGEPSTNKGVEWRKQQLEKLEKKFTDREEPLPLIEVDSEDDLQPMWKQMESRVKYRKSLTIEEQQRRGQPVGRTNVRKTDEEMWLQEGLYDENEDDKAAVQKDVSR